MSTDLKQNVEATKHNTSRLTNAAIRLRRTSPIAITPIYDRGDDGEKGDDDDSDSDYEYEILEIALDSRPFGV